MIKKRNIALKLIIILIIISPLINPFLISIVDANTNYTIDLEKGTQILEVKIYDAEAWKNTINITSTPSDWFGGEADKIGAKSKITVSRYGENDLNAYFLFVKLVIPQNILPIFFNISSYGYGFPFIENNYPYYYQFWDYEYQYWNFTSEEFNDYPDTSYETSFILEYPQNFSTLLDDYNDFAGKINNDTNLQLLGYTFPILSGDDLLWQFITKRFFVPNPHNEYLTTFINAIGCKNVTIKDNTLIFQRHGIKSYTIEVTYGIEGLLDLIIVKNSVGHIIYEITSFYPKTIFYVILGLIAIFSLGIAVLVIVKKIKINKQFK